MFNPFKNQTRQQFADTPDEAPLAPARETTLAAFGETRSDPYAWLRDENWRDVLKDPGVLSQEIRTHLENENAYYEAGVSHLASLRETLFREMRGRIKEDDSEPPRPDGPFEYYTRFRDGGEHPVFARRARGGGDEKVLYDGDAEKGDTEFFDIAGVYHSPDHRYVAHATDRVGSEYFAIRIRDAETGEELPETVPNADGGVAWAKDSASFFYVERDEQQRPKRVRRHVLGADPASDELVYEEPDDSYFLGVSKSQSGEYLFITSSKSTSSEVRFLRADAPAGEAPVVIAPREEDMLYYAEHHGDEFFIQTNADGAIDFKIVRMPIEAPDRNGWRDFLPARDGVFLRSFLPLKDWLVRLETENALPRIVISDWKLKRERTLKFDEAAYALAMDAGYEFETDSVRVIYESPATPEETYDVDLKTDKRALVKRQEIPSGHDKSAYVVERVSLMMRDGAETPVTILRAKETKFDKRAPLFLYGYGAYGISIPAYFSAKILSLVDRGVVYAVAHVRGGADKGRRWYLDGKLDKKENTFDDFIDVAKGLHDSGRSSAERTVIFGGSAGGLLVGAALNRAPDRFAGAIGAVPFVDVLNTISDENLPLTPPEWSEWGDPIRDEAAFRRIGAYSPYDNIRRGATYPPILATGGIADYRVTYWEPAKWIARLRAEAKGGPFFLRMDMGAGHGGSAARFERLKEDAEYYAFALEVFGLAGS